MARRLTPIALLLLIAGLSAQAGQTCYRADGDSGEIGFSGVADDTDFRGRFRDFEVRVCLSDETLAGARIEVSVATGSADVGNREGNEALTEGEFFAVDRYPQATWTSSAIEADGDGYRAEGVLSIKSVDAEQPVELKLETDGDVWRLSGSAEIMRLDWNVGTGEFDDTDFIRNRVDLDFDLALEPAED